MVMSTIALTPPVLGDEDNRRIRKRREADMIAERSAIVQKFRNRRPRRHRRR